VKLVGKALSALLPPAVSFGHAVELFGDAPVEGALDKVGASENEITHLIIVLIGTDALSSVPDPISARFDHVDLAWRVELSLGTR